MCYVLCVTCYVINSIAPTVIYISAKLKTGQPAMLRIAMLAGQNLRSMKSMTQPYISLSIMFDMPPENISANPEMLRSDKFEIDFNLKILNLKLRIKINTKIMNITESAEIKGKPKAIPGLQI